jgi:hypothetical protein
MKGFVVAVASLLIGFPAIAGPGQLDILGLIPDVSEKADVERVAIRVDGSVVILQVGGHNIPCIPEYLNGKLAELACLTGKDGSTNYTDATNSKVHLELWVGFVKKFGKVDFIDKKTMRTAMGVEYENSIVKWKDKKGNVLMLNSIFDRPTSGLVVLQSNDYLKKESAQNEAREASKKF